MLLGGSHALRLLLLSHHLSWHATLLVKPGSDVLSVDCIRMMSIRRVVVRRWLWRQVGRLEEWQVLIRSIAKVSVEALADDLTSVAMVHLLMRYIDDLRYLDVLLRRGEQLIQLLSLRLLFRVRHLLVLRRVSLVALLGLGRWREDSLLLDAHVIVIICW